jgi:serine carboxypeptidase-like clade II
MIRFVAVALLLIACTCIAGIQCAREADRVHSLPGFEGDFSELPAIYSGYVTLNASADRNIFYYFAQSEGNPASDPVVLFLQGGPGCASGIAFLTENGPLSVNPANPDPSSPNCTAPSAAQTGIDLIRNGWSWTRQANVLWIESPFGVGFSHSGVAEDYNNADDPRTADENYRFLQLWYELFPEFKSNEFVISGESYAGSYGMFLAQKIIDGSDVALAKRLGAIMLGNPVISCPYWKTFGNDMQIDIFYWRSMISLDMYMQWKQSNCSGTTANPPPHCQVLIDEISAMPGVYDPDNLYSSDCSGNATLLVDPNRPGCVSIQTRRNDYLNRADVQSALHARVGTDWQPCTNPPQLNYTTSWPNLLPIYERVKSVRPDVRILLYSGTADVATVPGVGYTQPCIRQLGWPIVEKWRPWLIDGSTAGYVEVHDGLTFVTLKGLGHEAAGMYGGRTPYNMLTRFLNNEKF